PRQNHRLERVEQRRDHANHPENQPNRMHSASRAGIRPRVNAACFSVPRLKTHDPHSSPLDTLA
ncbi:MAG: hypothetical protein WBD32_13045, partial [Acidobacteriaceae bacterium]